jgi:hypothetical protein
VSAPAVFATTATGSQLAFAIIVRRAFLLLAEDKHCASRARSQRNHAFRWDFVVSKRVRVNLANDKIVCPTVEIHSYPEETRAKGRFSRAVKPTFTIQAAFPPK